MHRRSIAAMLDHLDGLVDVCGLFMQPGRDMLKASFWCISHVYCPLNLSRAIFFGLFFLHLCATPWTGLPARACLDPQTWRDDSAGSWPSHDSTHYSHIQC